MLLTFTFSVFLDANYLNRHSFLGCYEFIFIIMQAKYCQFCLFTAISRPGGYEVYRLVSNITKFPKGRKPLQAECLSLPLSNQKEILKRGTTFKVQFIAIANPSYIDLVHQCIILILKLQTELLDSVHSF